MAPLPRMYSREYETGLFAFDGPASDVRFIAVGTRLRPNLKALKGAVEGQTPPQRDTDGRNKSMLS